MKHLLLSLSLVFSAAAAHASATEGVQAGAKPAAPKMAIGITGATSMPAKAPLMLSIAGAKATEPSFEVLEKAAVDHPEWVVVALKPDGDRVRVSLRSKDKKATLDMDTAQRMAEASNLEKGSTVTMNVQKFGQAVLLRIMKDNIPLGFMANENVQLPKN